MKKIKRRISSVKESTEKHFSKWYIWCCSDVHWGADTFNKTKFLRYVEWAKRTPNVKIILLGDLMENAIPTHIPEASFEQALQPGTQLRQLADILKPLKDKILCAVTGNHELRTYYKAGLDPTEILCMKLGIDYRGVGGYLTIPAGKQTYNFVIHHGASASVTNMEIDLKRMRIIYPEGEIYLAGHNHFLGSWKRKALLRNPKDDRDPKEGYIHYVRTGSFLEYAGYSHRKLYEPQPTGSAIVKLYTDYHLVDVSDSDKIGQGLAPEA